MRFASQFSPTHVGSNSLGTREGLAQSAICLDVEMVSMCTHYHLAEEGFFFKCLLSDNSGRPRLSLPEEQRLTYFLSRCLSLLNSRFLFPPLISLSRSVFSQCAKSCLKGWWRSSVPLPVRPPTPSSAISVERKRWVHAPRWQRGRVRQPVDRSSRNKFGIMMPISCSVGFVGDGNIFCKWKMMKYLNSVRRLHPTSTQIKAPLAVLFTLFPSLAWRCLACHFNCFGIFIATTKQKYKSSCCIFFFVFFRGLFLLSSLPNPLCGFTTKTICTHKVRDMHMHYLYHHYSAVHIFKNCNHRSTCVWLWHPLPWLSMIGCRHSFV